MAINAPSYALLKYTYFILFYLFIDEIKTNYMLKTCTEMELWFEKPTSSTKHGYKNTLEILCQ